MTNNLEPREVERPFIGRWLRMTVELIVRSPFRFGIMIAFLTSLDNGVVTLAKGVSVEKFWIDRIGDMLLPTLWVLTSALARGADDTSSTWVAFAPFRHKRVWLASIGSAALIVSLDILLAWALHGAGNFGPFRPVPYLQHPGDLTESIARNAYLFVVAFGPCYFPLLALAPEASPWRCRLLSRQASKLNGELVIWLIAAIVVLSTGVLASIAPAYGLTNSLLVVFLGVFNYVVYRDIFERRSGNLPKKATSSVTTEPAPLAHESRLRLAPAQAGARKNEPRIPRLHTTARSRSATSRCGAAPAGAITALPPGAIGGIEIGNDRIHSAIVVRGQAARSPVVCCTRDRTHQCTFHLRGKRRSRGSIKRIQIVQKIADGIADQAADSRPNQTTPALSQNSSDRSRRNSHFRPQEAAQCAYRGSEGSAINLSGDPADDRTYCLTSLVRA